MTRYPLPHGEIIRARVESVYPTIADGSVTLVHSDGPYGLGKAGWDRVRDLAAWYRPHIAEWSRICAPSASVYLWNTAEGWATIHPEMMAAGWRFRVLVIWNKGKTLAVCHSDRAWTDHTEVCGYYSREPEIMGFRFAQNGNVWSFAEDSYRSERLFSDETIIDNRGWKWNKPIHPCQKPLSFAERVIRASSVPGDLVFEPFGGTCRIAVANERLARFHPDEARRTLTVEQDEDGREYIAAVLQSLGGDLGAPEKAKGQIGLFGGGA